MDNTNIVFIDDPVYSRNHNIFPWREYTTEEIQNDYNRLKKRLRNDNIKFPLIYCRMGLKCTDIFFQQCRLGTPSQSKKSCIAMWEKNTSKILLTHYRRKKGDLFGTIVFMFHAPAHFPVYVAGMVYKYFNGTKIFDPYAGWGNRCLAAMALDINYVGIDSNPDLVDPYKKLLSEYKYTSDITFISNFSENVDIESMKFDLVFTSPPFWNDKIMLEKYSNSETDYETFLNSSLFPVLEKCFKKGCPVCLYINKKMYKSIEKKYGSYSEILEFKSPTNNKKNYGRINTIYCWNTGRNENYDL